MHGPFERCIAQSKAARSAQNSGIDEKKTPSESSNSTFAFLGTNPEFTGGKILSNVPHHASPRFERYAATLWMPEEAIKSGTRHLISGCVKNVTSNSLARLKPKSRRSVGGGK